VNSKRIIEIVRWLVAGLSLAGIVSFLAGILHANPATAALCLLLLVLFLAARWGLRYAIVTSLAATLCYNYYFLPPLGQFTISDPENVLALFAFLSSAVFASRMSNRIRQESEEARARQAELEVLYRLSRALLQTDELAQLTNSIPATVALATGAQGVLFYLLNGDRVYRSGADWTVKLSTEDLRELSHNPGIISSASQHETMIPLRTGVRPAGVLIVRGTQLSHQSLDALGGLVSISLDRASAMDDVTRAEAAKESERLRGLMLDSITHELRTPLTSIKGAVSALLTSTLKPDVTHELLTVIDEESDRLNRLVAQAVEMAQLDTQEVRMTFTPQKLGDMIDAAVEAYKVTLAEHPLTVTLAPHLPEVDADPVWIQKLLGNILENAAKYSAQGQPIFISAEMRGPMVACSVADRGAGIDPMEQSLIFDKFYRARNRAHHTPGTGMGLAICRAIAEAHGGTISVTSQPGHGSVFTFTLPAHNGDI
jgi:two-component system sensor histidine kinase KdpD